MPVAEFMYQEDENQNFKLISSLNKNNFQTYNRDLAKSLGINAAIFLSELINRYEYHKDKDQLIVHESHGEEWFYHTIQHVKDRTGLTREKQDTALKRLKEFELVDVKIFGLPSRRHFRLNVDKIIEIFDCSQLPKCSQLSTKCSQKQPFSPNFRRNEEKIHKLECVKHTNWIADTQQPSHYRRRTQNKKTTTTEEEKVVVVVHNYEKPRKDINEELIKQNAQALKSCLDKKANDWGHNWRLPLSLFVNLIRNYGDCFVLDQVSYMMAQQNQSILDQNKHYLKQKSKPIEKPETYFKLACQKNYALSQNI